MRTIGIDVGGTNTDAALISRDWQVLGMVKAPTNHKNILASTKSVMQQILSYNEDTKPIQLHLSTTLSTNAIIEGKGEPTAVLAIPGPGINLANLGFGFPVYQLSGYIDHRGRRIRSLEKDQVLQAAADARANGIKALAIVGKFSQRNYELEKDVKAIISEAKMNFSHITLGHQLSGRLNFPRRIMTAYLNASVAGTQIRFVDMLNQLKKETPIISHIRILKADGGTMGLDESCIRPVETILSGPAASIMASQSLSSYTQDNAVVIDIGGTTTDIAVIVGGEALYQRNGAEIGGKKTLVPALLTHSIGLGGDSQVHIEQDRIRLGPKRAGTPVILGGKTITPTDAAGALGLIELGDVQRAIYALEGMAQGKFSTWENLAQGIIDAFVRQLEEAIRNTYLKLENMPVYTVSEILAPPNIRPRVVIGLGAPAPIYIPLVAKELKLPWEILPHHAGANGIGAAASRPTIAATLHVDTEQELLIIPELGYQKQIRKSALFEENHAKTAIVEQISAYGKKLGLKDYEDVQIVEKETFNVVRGFYTAGKIFNIKAQIRPSVRRVIGGEHYFSS